MPKSEPKVVVAERFEMLPWRQLMESKHNSRKTFNQHKLEELAASIRDRGIITPLIVRPTPTEVISGGDRAPVYDGKVKAHVDFKDIEGQVRAELAEAAQKKAGKGAGK